MCETSERGERIIQREEILPISLEIGRRILELFAYQPIRHIVFRLKSTSREIHSVIDGECLPSTELLLGIQRVTGASIDWLLTGKGSKYARVLQIADHAQGTEPSSIWVRSEPELPLQKAA
jgi:hypothetical protein